MKILFLESFYGGSHRDVADAIVAASRHEVELRTLPARFWKWRVRGAALSFAHELSDAHAYDLIVCTGLMSVADLRALLPGAGRPSTPILLYAHETQIVYPSLVDRGADLHFAFTDLTNMLAADHVAFNSNTHRDAFLGRLPAFLRRLPEHRPMWTVGTVEQKSSVCEPGIGWHPDSPRNATDGGDEAPLIIWNHRWEFDKDPQTFFAVLHRIAERGIGFRLALLGENFQVVPKPFLAAKEAFAGQIVQYGYVADRKEYERWLSRADIVVSTAIQENFGISVMEAIAYGAAPLLPDRLSYPEIVPTSWHDALYGSVEELEAKLVDQLLQPKPPPAGLVSHARSFAWNRRIGEFDALFERVAEGADGEARG